MGPPLQKGQIDGPGSSNTIGGHGPSRTRIRTTAMSRLARYAIAAGLVTAAAVAGTTLPVQSQPKAGAKKLDLAHIIAPPESGAIAYKYFAEEVTKRSGGTLNVVF